MQEKPEALVVLGGCHDFAVIKGLLAQLSFAICIAAWIASAPTSRAADSPQARNFLILYSFADRKALGDLALLRSILRSHVAVPVNFDIEYLESERFDVEGYEKSLSELPAQVYSGKKIDLVIAAAYPALRFAVDHRDQMFAGGPIVFISVSPSRLEGRTLWPCVTGVTTNVDVPRTIDLALQRQLRRWNIPESALPPGAIVLFRQPTWEHYERYIFAGIALIIVQELLILGLLIQRARKRKIEISLRESEKRFRAMVDITPSLVWMSDKYGLVTYLNERRIDFTGRDSTDGFGDTWTAYIHPDDLQNVVNVNRLALEQRKEFSKEYRLRRRDGVYRWMFDVASPRIDEDGTFAGFIGSAIDVTDQKLAQEALEKIGGRLIAAQEKERSRIARELHDDICQRLALLSLELTQAIQGSNGANGTANARIAEIQQHCSEIAGDVQALSHELHSSKLDYLGIVAALASFCREFSKQHNVYIEFTHEDVPNPLTSDVSLCFFRVAQEALHNAVKYSGVSRFSIDLRRTADQLQLEVRDAGVGFDLEQAKRNEGLGLASMQERVHLMNGEFSIETKANHGTKILVRVPWVGEVNTTDARTFVV